MIVFCFFSYLLCISDNPPLQPMLTLMYKIQPTRCAYIPDK